MNLIDIAKERRRKGIICGTRGLGGLRAAFRGHGIAGGLARLQDSGHSGQEQKHVGEVPLNVIAPRRLCRRLCALSNIGMAPCARGAHTGCPSRQFLQ